MAWRSQIRIVGSKIRNRHAPENGLPHKRGMREPISIPSRTETAFRHRIRELLDVETYDSLQKVGNRVLLPKAAASAGTTLHLLSRRHQTDRISFSLIQSQRGTGPHTAVKPLRVSPDGRLLLYEIKQGGERTGTFELLDIQKRETLPDVLPRGYLRGFAFAPDSTAFYYVHEAVGTAEPTTHRAAYQARSG